MDTSSPDTIFVPSAVNRYAIQNGAPHPTPAFITFCMVSGIVAPSMGRAGKESI